MVPWYRGTLPTKVYALSTQKFFLDAWTGKKNWKKNRATYIQKKGLIPKMKKKILPSLSF